MNRAMTYMAAVAAVAVSKTYGEGDAAVRALDEVSLDVEAGSWIAVMGPSGSGKSTLLHALAGLERVDAGQVFLGDREISAMSEAKLTRLRRNEIGFAFQNFNLISSLTAAQNIAASAGRYPSQAGRPPLGLGGRRPR